MEKVRFNSRFKLFMVLSAISGTLLLQSSGCYKEANGQPPSRSTSGSTSGSAYGSTSSLGFASGMSYNQFVGFASAVSGGVEMVWKQYPLSKKPKQVMDIPVGATILDVDEVSQQGRISVNYPASSGGATEARTLFVVELEFRNGQSSYKQLRLPEGYHYTYLGDYNLDYSTFYVYEGRKL